MNETPIYNILIYYINVCTVLDYAFAYFCSVLVQVLSLYHTTLWTNMKKRWK